MSYNSDEGVELVTERLRQFFDPVPRFKLEECIGRGANGIVCRLIRDGTRLALKICPFDIRLADGKSWDEDQEEEGKQELVQINNEAEWLRVS